jgi:hypothetical protein
MKASARRLVPPVALGAVYAAALLVPFRVFRPRFTTHLIGDHGDALLLHLHCAWQWLALAEGRVTDLLDLPTMHPYSSGFVFGETLLGITLPLAPIQLLSGSTAGTFNTAVLLSFFLLGLSVFLWGRELFASPAAGLLAAVLVVFPPWRLHFLSSLNNLTIHYAVFGMWLLWRWLRRPQLATLVGAALLFHVQLITTAQVGLAAVYLSCIWLWVVWIGSGRAVERRRVVQLLVAFAVFMGLGLPWLGFFREAFDATPGLMRTDEMKSYSSPFSEMARLVGALGPLGIGAAAGAVALAIGLRRGVVSRGTGLSLLGLAVGTAVLFLVGRGPYLGPETDPTPLPGYYAARFLPLLDAIRAPIRLTALTPVFLALLAGGGLSVVEALSRSRRSERGARAWLLLPLLFTLLWPALPPEMGTPIALRPEDRALADELAKLPAASVILPLPMDLEPSRAAVDERVLVHRRAQIGGFASIIAEPFRHARLSLGQWPTQGTEAARALGATHLVVPARWLDRHAAAIDGQGYAVVATVAGHAILAMPPDPGAVRSLRFDVPTLAAADRWLSLSVASTAPGFDARGHRRLAARWTSPAGVTEVAAHAFIPGIGGPDQPVRVQVPTPVSTGPHELVVDYPGGPIEARVAVRATPTSLDAAVRDVSIALAKGYRVPASVRAGEPFRVGVELRVGDAAPILLATSRCDLPERCGETTVAYQYRGGGMLVSAEMPARLALSRDLAPGEASEQAWYLLAPPWPGRFAVFARLGARGSEARMPWTELIGELTVVRD